MITTGLLSCEHGVVQREFSRVGNAGIATHEDTLFYVDRGKREERIDYMHLRSREDYCIAILRGVRSHKVEDKGPKRDLYHMYA